VSLRATGAATITAAYQGVTAMTLVVVAAPGTAVLTHGTLTGTIDGVRWDATVSFASIITSVLTIAGGDGITTLAIATPTMAGSYTLGFSTPSNALVVANGSRWTAGGGSATGSGTVVVSSLTATGASGTFNMNLTPAAGPATAAKVITDGVFNLTF
jgi:hypothetical protein